MSWRRKAYSDLRDCVTALSVGSGHMVSALREQNVNGKWGQPTPEWSTSFRKKKKNLPPLKGSTACQNSATCWGPRAQIDKPVGTFHTQITPRPTLMTLANSHYLFKVPISKSSLILKYGGWTLKYKLYVSYVRSTVQLVNCLPCKQKCLSWIPRAMWNKLGLVAHAYNLIHSKGAGDG